MNSLINFEEGYNLSNKYRIIDPTGLNKDKQWPAKVLTWIAH